MGEQNGTSDYDEVLSKAKAILKSEEETGQGSIYDHLSDVLSRLLDNRTVNATEVIENYMNKSKEKKIAKGTEGIKLPGEIRDMAIVEVENSLFKVDSGDGEGADPQPDNDEESESPLPNVMELAFYFELAGVGLGREEMYKLFLCIKQLVNSYPLVSARFWGKIFGLEANYYVAEVEFREGEEGEEEEEPEEEEAEKAEEKEEEGSEDGKAVEEDILPKSQWKPPVIIPKEEHHIGANKKVYFVCTDLGKPWTKLPHVTPAQIVGAREIRKFFTGYLDAQVNSYPIFPGNEANYLRAQIARISAATHISPAGYYMFEEDEDEEEEMEMRDTFVPNVEFEGLSVRELADGNMVTWVHHVQHILPQGRCTWFNPFEKPEEDFEDEELDEEEEVEDETVQPEAGPTLLSPVSDDERLQNGLPPWTAFISSRVLPEYGVAVARSNRWPGAYAFGKGKQYENIYIGYGHKYHSSNYSPPPPPTPFIEYTIGPEVMEVSDPTVEEEQAVKQAQEEARKENEDTDDGDDEDEDDD